MLPGGASALRFARVNIRSNSSDPVSEIAESVQRAAPELGRGALALVDSPRAPNASPTQRDIDVALRATIASVNRKRNLADRITLSLFPTPPPEYFARCINDRSCKPHLISIARKVLGIPPGPTGSRPRSGGWIFTRFMIAGFAAHLALERLGVDAFEGYPYLAFAMWKQKGEVLPPKSAHRAALIARQKIVARLARECGLAADIPRTLDHADAAVLAITARLSARHGGTLFFASPEQGRFLLALDSRERTAVEEASVLDRA
ncbi:MAG TPA: DUF429 domain-containing protein [Candidatus Binataceae bacterium]|nr:DUF429 domain-containing protein [Candidatus Binataceae bacterium]